MAKNPNSKSLPVNQMLSQDQSSDFISFWLKRWLRDVKKLPIEVTIDQSKALLNAVIDAFTSCKNVGTYINQCLKYLHGGKNVRDCLPEVYIRFDRSHIVQYFTKKIKDADMRKTRLFRSVFGYLIQCKDFKVAKKIITDLFTLMKNQYIGCDSKRKPYPAEAAYRNLIELCATHDDRK